MNCPDCAAAATQPWHGYTGDCTGCKTRALATSIPFHDSVEADALTPAYRNALRVVFGEDWRAGHDSVKRWVREIERMKSVKTQT